MPYLVFYKVGPSQVWVHRVLHGKRAYDRILEAGENFVVAAAVDRSFERRYGDIPVRFVGLAGLIEELG
ncbi:MAG: hypothetical protein V3T72_19610 [Thermoanaerobaculia bacterium]